MDIFLVNYFLVIWVSGGSVDKIDVLVIRSLWVQIQENLQEDLHSFHPVLGLAWIRFCLRTRDG